MKNKTKLMENIQLIIPIGGFATRLSPLSVGMSKGFLSLHNMPAVHNIIYDCAKQGLKDVVIITSPRNDKLVKDFLNKSFKNLNINYVVQTEPKGTLHAIQVAEPLINKESLIVMADKYFNISDVSFEKSFLGYKTITDNSHSESWLVETDENEKVLGFINKPKHKVNVNKARMGIYFFKNPTILKQSLLKEHATVNNEYNLATLMEYYMQNDNIYAIEVLNWENSGSLYSYSISRRKIESDKYSFKVDDFLKITKTAKNKKDISKLNNEYNWMKKISKTNASLLFPQILFYENDKYAMEYLDYLTLFEYLMFYPILNRNQNYIFSEVVKSINFLHNTNIDELDCSYKEFNYNNLDAENILNNFIENYGNLEVNGFSVKNLKEVILKNENLFKNLNNTAKIGVVHNNLYFSNIFYMPSISGVKFISPKGNNGELLGDVRLDYAMLKLNYAVRIEAIEKNLFVVEEYNGKQNITWLTDNLPIKDFDDIVKEHADIKEVNMLVVFLAFKKLQTLTENQKAALMFSLLENFSSNNLQI